MKDIPDYGEKYPDATIILNTFTNEEIDWNTLVQYNALLKGRLVLEVNNYLEMMGCKEHNLKFYSVWPVCQWAEANNLKELGVCYILLSPPLTHMLDKVAELGIPVRFVPNVAYVGTFPHKNGVTGSWIRPEDVEAYGQYVDVLEFEDCDTKKEQALFRIYKSGEWPGELEHLITNLNYKGTNRLIKSETSQRRMTCGQKCEEPNRYCHLCYSFLGLADPELLSPIAEKYAEALNRIPN